MKDTPVSRRRAMLAGSTALAVGAAAALIGKPAKGAAADPVVAMFAERNRLFLEWVAIGARAMAESAVIDAKRPPRPNFPRRPEGMDFEEARSRPEYLAWRQAEDAWLKQNGDACRAAYAERHDQLEEDEKAVFDKVCELSADIANEPASSPLGLAIKLWIACDFANIGNNWEMDEADNLTDAAVLSAFHGTCRIHGLTVEGFHSRLGGGVNRIGSRCGEPVNEAAS